MAGKRYKLLKQKKDCALMFDTITGYYKIMDCENFVVCLTMSKELAEESYARYSIDSIRKEREKVYLDWLKSNAE